MNLNQTTLIKDIDSTALRSSNHITFKVKENEPVATNDMFTTDLTKFSKIRMDGIGEFAKLKAVSLHAAFHNAIEKAAFHPALKYKNIQHSDYLTINFRDYYILCCMAAKSFIKLGLNPRHSVCISGFNSPPWHIAFFGTIFAAGVASGVYTTNNNETVQFILNNCESDIAVLGSLELVEKYIAVAPNCPNLKAIVQFYGLTEDSLKNKSRVPIYHWEEFLKLGYSITDQTLVDRLDSLIPNQCCSLIYTSGTTGNPKGVMMSHDNLVWTATCLQNHVKFRSCKENLISYLPLSHVAAQMCDIILPLICQATVFFAQPDALKGSLGQTLREVHPTYFIGVPRVFEKIMEQMKEIGATLSGLKKIIGAWAKDIGYRTNIAKMNKEEGPYGYTIAKALVFNKIHKQLGFDRCLGVFSAAAPLNPEVLSYFASIDIVVCEIYGMSECSGPGSVGFPNDFHFGSVGKLIPDFQLKLDEKEGEICMNGRHIFMGYLGAVDKTKEAFDAKYWLHSGDVGKIDKDGFTFITGRIKELIITAGGENIAPVPIEEEIKTNIQLVSNAFLVGDKRKFLVVLLTIKCVMNLDIQCPTDELTPAAKRWCHSVGYEPVSVSKLIKDKDPKVTKEIDKGISKANEAAISSAARVQKWTFLPQDFSIHGGELGPTLKVKRNVVVEKYASIIEKLYQ